MGFGIRIRITALAAAMVALVLGLTAVALVATQRRALTENLEEVLAAAADDLVQQEADGRLPAVLAPVGDDDALAQVARGPLVAAATPNLAGHPVLTAAPEGAASTRSLTVFPNEPDYLVVTRRSNDVVVQAGAPLDDVADSLAALRLGLSLSLPAVVAVLALATWWLVGRTLRPVEAIRSQVADITGRNLHRRVPEPAVRDEIQRLARTMNEMLDRLQASADLQQRFVADASHELRSPLTRIRAELEVDALHPATADLVATHHSVLEETRNLQRLVDDLLLLAHADATSLEGPGRDDSHPSGGPGRDPDAGPPPGRSHPTRGPVDLDDIVLAEARHLSARASIALDTSAVSGAQVTGDPDQLRRLVRNLLDNAGRHAAARVTVALTSDRYRARLIVSDDGAGVDPDFASRIFDRFTRADPARRSAGAAGAGGAGGGGGAGLGLAIVREIATKHGGTVTLDPGGQPGTPGARFVVDLPLAPDGTSEMAGAQLFIRPSR
jgi:signal transduction histidine kinase